MSCLKVLRTEQRYVEPQERNSSEGGPERGRQVVHAYGSCVSGLWPTAGVYNHQFNKFLVARCPFFTREVEVFCLTFCGLSQEKEPIRSDTTAVKVLQ